MYIPFQVLGIGSDSVCQFNIKVDGASGYWRVPARRKANSNDYFLEILLPRRVRGGDFNLTFNAQLCGGSISETVSTLTKVSPVIDCGTDMEGSIGLTIRRFDLGDKKGTVNIDYDCFGIRDRIDLKYDGKYIYSTGNILNNDEYPTCSSFGFVSGEGSYSFEYDPAKSRSLEVYVRGNCVDEDTRWIVSVSCPD
jgi:hypothetical protein